MTLAPGDPTTALLDKINDLETRMASLERAPWNDSIGTGGVLVTGDLVGGFGATRAGCLLCNGATIADADYPALGAFIRANLPAAYVVDGTHVKLPDYRGAALAGADGATFVLGTEVGVETVTLTAAQSGVPAHTHPAPTITIGSEASHTHSGTTGAGSAHAHTFGGGGTVLTTYNGVNQDHIFQVTAGSAWSTNGGTQTNSESSHTHGFTTGAGSSHTHTGSSSTIAANTTAAASSSHSNVQPTLPANWFIKT